MYLLLKLIHGLIIKVSQAKSQWDDEPKIKFKKTKYGVATIVYFAKVQKNRKNKTKSAKSKFWVQESVTRMK